MIEYTVVRGFTYPGNVIPLLGLMPLVASQPAYVTITDSKTGTKTTVSDDTVADIYWRYEDIRRARPDLLHR